MQVKRDAGPGTRAVASQPRRPQAAAPPELKETFGALPAPVTAGVARSTRCFGFRNNYSNAKRGGSSLLSA